MATKQRKPAGKGVFPTAEYDRYENAENSLVSVTNHDMENDPTNKLFQTVKEYHKVSIRTDNTITVKFNSISNTGITITSSDSPFESPEGMRIRSIFVTNSGTAAVKILGV